MWDSIKPVLGRILHFAKGSGAAIREPETADLRVAIRAAVRRRVDFSGNRYVFPARAVAVELFARDEMERAALQRVMVEERGIEKDLKALLEGEDCEYPQDLRVTVSVAGGPSPNAEPFLITYEAEERPLPAESAPRAETADAAAGASGPPPPETQLALEVLTGSANVARLVLDRKVTNIGRLDTVYRAGRFERRNDLAFTDEANGVNETVARQHAHIVWARDGYRLYDSGGGSGKTLVVRDGRPYRATVGGPGIRLQPGDEIHLAAAQLKVSSASN